MACQALTSSSKHGIAAGVGVFGGKCRQTSGSALRASASLRALVLRYSVQMFALTAAIFRDWYMAWHGTASGRRQVGATCVARCAPSRMRLVIPRITSAALDVLDSSRAERTCFSSFFFCPAKLGSEKLVEKKQMVRAAFVPLARFR